MVDLKTTLFHHPPHSLWFRDFDRKTQSALLPKFDFVLRGHEHEAIAHTVHNLNTDDEYVHIAGGALYDASEYKGKTGYPISFNAVRINLDTGKGIIFYWQYFTDLYGWKKDVIAEDRLKLFDVPEKVLARVRNLSPNSSPSFSTARAGTS